MAKDNETGLQQAMKTHGTVRHPINCRDQVFVAMISMHTYGELSKSFAMDVGERLGVQYMSKKPE